MLVPFNSCAIELYCWLAVVVLPPSGAVVLDGEYDPDWAHQAGISLRVRF